MLLISFSNTTSHFVRTITTFQILSKSNVHENILLQLITKIKLIVGKGSIGPQTFASVKVVSALKLCFVDYM